VKINWRFGRSAARRKFGYNRNVLTESRII
jgi:hypothetical protein